MCGVVVWVLFQLFAAMSGQYETGYLLVLVEFLRGFCLYNQMKSLETFVEGISNFGCKKVL